jgi:CDP-diacylglycerol--glycerol-3-phosphate 3-phosphatidyltransferase
MIPLFVVAFYVTAIPYNYLISAVIFCLAAFTDFLDGYIARKYNLVTNLGKFLDPIADKVLVSTALIVMLNPVSVQILPDVYGAVAVSIILARELIVSGFRMVAASKGAVLAADWSGKIKTFVTDVAIVVLLVTAQFAPELYSVPSISGLVLLAVATILTLYSGIECIVKNRAVLKDDKPKSSAITEIDKENLIKDQKAN